MIIAHQIARSFHRFGPLLERQVPKTLAQYKELKEQEINQPENAKLLRVALIGTPNTGKSTLLNQLVNWKVSAVSSKAHTTQGNVVGVFVRDETQIEFVDTPGLVHRKQIKKHKLGPSFATDVQASLAEADTIAVLTDISNPRDRERLNTGIIEALRRCLPEKESILILNKVDKFRKKRELIDVTRTLTSGVVGGKPIFFNNYSKEMEEIHRGEFEALFKRTEQKLLEYKDKIRDEEEENKGDGIGWHKFDQVFMISALNDDGVEELRSYLVNKAKKVPWIYNSDSVTTRKPKSLVIDALREVCLEMLYQEIPYNIYFEIVMWEMDDLGNLYIVVDMFIPDKFLSLVLGPKGSTISAIVRKSREVLSTMFKCDVSLKLAAKKKHK